MSNSETRLKVIQHKTGYMGGKIATVVIEQGRIAPLTVFQSARTGTQYRLTSTPVYIGDAEVIGGLMDAEFLCNYYRAHKDFATNEEMQKICETKRGFTYGPIHFANIKPIPFRGELVGRNYVDEPEKYDLEVNDVLVSIDESM